MNSSSIQHVAPTRAIRSEKDGIDKTTTPVMPTAIARTASVAYPPEDDSTENLMSIIRVTGNIMTGYVKNSEKQRQALTRRGKVPGGRLSVMMAFVSGPKLRYPQTPNVM